MISCPKSFTQVYLILSISGSADELRPSFFKPPSLRLFQKASARYRTSFVRQGNIVPHRSPVASTSRSHPSADIRRSFAKVTLAPCCVTNTARS